mmetsp:Transcript_14992/g.17106  ORF Transcript_14992/g.17106 Transcript_14992/m.17106 type:complete len:212 (-) Transcript_14992:602-1237(-)
MKKKLYYINISPRYSLAPSPFPPMAFADAHFTELFAPMAFIIAPACSEGSFPDLYKASLTQTALNPLSLHTHASSTSSKALLSLAKMLAIVQTAAFSGKLNPSMTANFSSTSSTPVTAIILPPTSTASCASSLLLTATIVSIPTARAHLIKNSTFSFPATPNVTWTALAPAAALRAICTSSTIKSLQITGRGPGTSPFAYSCSFTIATISS